MYFRFILNLLSLLILTQLLWQTYYNVLPILRISLSGMEMESNVEMLKCVVSSIYNIIIGFVVSFQLQFENLRTHCTGECFRLYNKQFRADISDKTDRIIKFIVSCTDQCVNLMENAIEKEQNK